MLPTSVILHFALLGCSHPVAPAHENALAQNRDGQLIVSKHASKPKNIDEVLSLWAKGETPLAIKSLVELTESCDYILKCRLYDMTEAQFVAQPASRRDQLGEEILSKIMLLRGFVDEVLRVGNETITSGDSSKAKRHFQAVKRLGSANKGPEVPLLCDIVGNHFEKLADKAMARLRD